MKSLLLKAQEFRKAAGSELQKSGDFEFDEASGISSEDQREILIHIDRVSRSSRILPGPETWKVRPKRRGLALPLMVNLAGALILAAGLFALSRFFAPREEASGSASAALSSAEGTLLKEIKREAEGRLLEKDREIATIQQRMASLDKEREQLLSNVDARVKAKEEELRGQLKTELERERQRLVAEGLSEGVIQERLRDFERRKNEEFRSRLDEFAKQADEERLALQASLDKARDEFKLSLSDATAERQRIQDESRRREQELRVQLDDKSKALEAERARTADSLRSAQAELARLNEDAAKVRAAEDRLAGMYAAARQALRDGRVDDASRTLESLRGYLSDPQVAAMPALRSRRELDLFAVDLYERSISAERAKASADTSRVTAALDALAVVREEAERARAALAAGNAVAAGEAYRKALAATKELEEAGAFVEGSWKARLEEQAARFEAARLESERLAKEAAAEAGEKAAAAGAAEAKSALAAVEASARDGRALEAAFARLLARLPLGPGDAARIYAYVKDAGAREADLARGASDAAASAALQESRQASLARVATLEASLEAANLELADLRERVAATPPPAAAPAAPAPGAPSGPEYEALVAEKARLESELAAATRRYDAVTAAYGAYSSGEDAILGRGGDQALVEARAGLEAFLASPAVSAAMPGMRDRIARYLSSFQAAGQEEILFNAADIVGGAARIRDANARARYFQELEARYSGNPSMQEFLSQLAASLD